jgi:hypothetical protein
VTLRPSIAGSPQNAMTNDMTRNRDDGDIPRRPGAVIAAVAIPGAGKSTLLERTARLAGWTHLSEPSEEHWPPSVKDHDLAGVFTALAWFRAQRVANLWEAHRRRLKGETVLVDCYYDRLMSRYLGRPMDRNFDFRRQWG